MIMRTASIVFGISCLLLIPFCVTGGARKAACHEPIYRDCYGVLHNCPANCPKFCEVDCRLCKPYCACDKPGAVCQDPRFVGGDGIMFYFHGKKDKDFCLVTDSELHINAHFIGKKSKKGRDFTWVQSIGLMFGPHQLYMGAKKVAQWNESAENMLIELDGKKIMAPHGQEKSWQSPEIGLRLRRLSEMNKVEVKVEGVFEIVGRVVPITSEESRIHGYDITEEDCFAHLELNFKFESLNKTVDGVLGQTYRPSYRSRVRIAAAMPIMGGADKFSSSHILATDCAVSKFGLRRKGSKILGDGGSLIVECPSIFGGRGIACRR